MNVRRKQAVVFVLSVGSVVLLWKMYALYEKLVPARAAAATVTQTPESPDAEAASARRAENELRTILEAQQKLAAQPWGRDPFDPAPFMQSESAAPAVPSAIIERDPPRPPVIRLTGVSRTGQNWLAAIDGRIVRLGDTVNEKYQVVGIGNAAVTLEADGWVFEFTLGAATPIVRPSSEPRPQRRREERP